MKHTSFNRVISALIALVMLLSLIPASTLTAFAAGKTEVAKIETRISAEHVPYAGMEYKDLYTWIDAVIYGRAQNSGSDWVDDTGVTIEIKGDGAYGEWYDIRYQFEAGRTYTTEYTYMINPAYEETHMFTENTTVTLTNPDPSKCTITGEVIEVRDSGRICDVRYTMTIAGERSYPDIKAATLQKITTPADGVQAETTALMYSNCTLTAQSWSPNVGTFEAGNTYTLTVNLHAKDGYRFADDFAPVLGIEGYEKAADNVELLNSNKDAAVSFVYSVGNYTFIDTLELVPITGAADFFPVAGESASHFPDLFKPVDGAPYEKEWMSSRQWYNEDDRKYMEDGDVFEVGKTYSYYSIFRIKTENEGSYRFASPTVQLENFIYQNDVQTEVGDNPLRTYVTFYYTCKFPEGVGSSAGNPAYCYSYEEFKYAMESDDIRYVALGNVEDTLPLVSMEETGPYGDNRWPSIWVNSYKNLILLGNAQFTAPNAEENVHRVYDHLIQVRQGGRLAISGSGSLTFHGNAVGWPTSVAEVVDGGILTINSGTVKGDTGNRTSFCYGVNVNGGTLYVNDGTVIGTNRHNQAPISAVNLYDGRAYIYGGTFYSVVSDGAEGSNHYALYISNEFDACYITGGTFNGIAMPYDARMSDYIENGRVMTVNGVMTDPATCGTIGGYVEVYREISEVEIYVETPVAGESATVYPEDVYWVPEGCTVDSIVWYENGEALNLAYAPRFEAGSSYRVEIILVADNGVRFADPLTSAEISYKTATVNPHGGNAQKGIVMSVDFGVCPNIVPEVDLTVTAPNEGNKPSYTVGCGSDAYCAVGGSSNYTEYRKWYMSSDNDDWWEINGSHTFMSGYYYKLVVDICTNNGYEFPTYDDGSSIVPDVSATVNGCYANVIKAYDQDPSRYITVEYNFGECNDSVVESIIVENVTEPIAGAYPSYSYSISGTGYRMNTAKNAYYDDWQHNQKLYYIKNGIGWFDLTESNWVYENEKFIPGHQYIVNVYLITDDGYEFAHSRYYEPTVTATVNGYVAEAVTSGSDCVHSQQVQYTFTCQPQEISTVMLYLDRPQAGKTPVDYPPEFACPQVYTGDPNYGINGTGVYWYDSQGNMIFEEDKFVEGEKYKLEIKVIPAKLEGVNVCKFASSVTVYINGKEFVPSGDWDAVYANSGVVYIYYSFTRGAAAPAVQSIPGDFNKDDVVTNDDVVALMWNVLFPEQYPLDGNTDLNHDGQTTNADVVALMWYVLFPEQYPLG